MGGCSGIAKFDLCFIILFMFWVVTYKQNAKDMVQNMAWVG